MKNLLKKIRNFKLIRETKGEVVLATIVVTSILLLAFGFVGEWATDMQPYTYAAGEERKGDVTNLANESTSPPTIAKEESKAVGVVIVINGVPTFGKFSSGSPDPTPINKLNEEIVLPEEEYKSTESVEEFFGSSAVVEYALAISDENKKNQSEESESNKISDIKTKKQLDQEQLPNDKLSIDIYNSIKNIVSENIKNNQLVGDIENISAELVKDIFSREEGTSNSEGNVVNAIKKNLEQKKLLAEKEVSEKRKYLKLALQAKEEYEQRVAVIDRLGVDSIWAKNLIDYKNDKRIIEDLNRKISEAEQFLKNYETEIAGETTPESVSENGWTDAAQPTETTPDATQPDETSSSTSTTNTALPSELNLKGNLILNPFIGGSIPLTLNINLETLVVSGIITYSGPYIVSVYDANQDGVIPGSERDIIYQRSVDGTINGKIDIINKDITGDYSFIINDFYEGKNYTSTYSGAISGSLDENNQASGTFFNDDKWSNEYSWSASPY